MTGQHLPASAEGSNPLRIPAGPSGLAGFKGRLDWNRASQSGLPTLAAWATISRDWETICQDWAMISLNWERVSLDWEGVSFDWETTSFDWERVSLDW